MNDTGVTHESEIILRRLGDAFPYVSPEASGVAWMTLTVAVLLLGVVFVIWMYVRDTKSIRWYVAAPLAFLRICVYVLLAVAFLLPAKQTWEKVEKRSRVVMLIDVSPSVTEVTDEIRSASNPQPKTRLEKVIDFLTDENVAFIRKLTEKNPTYVYRFGSRLDEEAQPFQRDSPPWTAADWDAWARYDFKPWVLRGLSPPGRDAVRQSAAWNGDEPGNASWAIAWLQAPDEEAIPAGLSPEDQERLKDNRAKLEQRVDVARAIVQGTNVPDSVTAAVNREAANMVQAIILFSDGRSNLGSDSAYAELKERANREKIPVFTVAVGEARENVQIVITDLQAPDRAPPDEPFKIIVEADGVGLERQEVDVTLALYLPTRDPKKDSPDHELTGQLVFEPGEPPHGQVEFIIDPDQLPNELTDEASRDTAKSAGKRRQLKQGAWSAVARIPRDRREVFQDPEHISPPRSVQVIESPLRVLLWASGPTREYQTLRTLLSREVDQKRAELSVYLQNEGGSQGNIVQDVPPERLLIRFPTRLDTAGRSTDRPEDKYYNLNEYDLIIAFDPDWSELSADQIENLENWVTNLGGGFLYVAGPIHTFQLARADESGRLRPLLQLLPVLPEDIILLRTRPIPRSPRRALLRPNPEWDVLKLDDAQDDPVAGWERFFTGQEKYVPDADPRKNLSPKNGFYSYYPIRETKPGAAVLMEFLDINEKGEPDPKPFLVASQPGKGRTAFLGSGEMWRTRPVDTSFFERFYIRLARHVSAGRRNVQSFRGQVLVNKEFISGSMVRVQTRLLQPNSKPYPPGAIDPKFRVEQYKGGEKVKEFGPYPFTERKGAAGFDGYYAAQILADPKLFPPGDYRYRVVVEVPDSPGDTISGEFTVKKSDPELDNPRPDFVALVNAASTLADLPGLERRNPDAHAKLRGTATDDSQAKLAFRLAETDKLAVIPDTLEARSQNLRNRGPVEDLWDKGVRLPESLSGWFSSRPVEISYLLLLAVGLLSVEWMTRKLVRLA
jgi:hypothetical protein